MDKKRKAAISIAVIKMINTRLKSSMTTHTGTKKIKDTTQHFFDRLKGLSAHIERLMRLSEEALDANLETLELLFEGTSEAAGEVIYHRIKRELKEIPSDNKFRLGWLLPILAAMFIAMETIDGSEPVIAFIALIFAVERVRLYFNANAAEACLDDLEYFWEAIKKPSYESDA